MEWKCFFGLLVRDGIRWGLCRQEQVVEGAVGGIKRALWPMACDCPDIPQGLLKERL